MARDGAQPVGGELGFSCEELIQEIVRICPPRETRNSGDVDVYQMMKAWGVSRDTARSRLRQLAKDGMLVSTSVIDRGHILTVYRKPDKVAE